MEFVNAFLDLFLHLDRHLSSVLEQYGLWTYLILFLIIFCETGLVITPFLPGDSLLFGVGALAAGTSLNVGSLFVLLSIAAVMGDGVNYWIGHWVGPKVFYRDDLRFLKREHLDRTEAFYRKYGGKTIILARFVPIIRTFAPFVAGIGRMSYRHFTAYNIGGGILWIGSFLFGGYFFGNIPIVKKNFTLVVLGIIFVSLLPGIIELLRARKQST
ncbi:MAG: DedA family protein [Candidatus Manganitrophaceae bacterium]